jgi:DNA transposition AAA+ family ATPase
MALSLDERRELLAAKLPECGRVVTVLRNFLEQAGLSVSDFAERIGYSAPTVYLLLKGKYECVSTNPRPLSRAIMEYIHANPIGGAADGSDGKLYETANVKLFRQCFNEVLDKGRCGCLVGDPGKQKTYVARHLIAELNRRELAKNGHGKRVFYIYVPQACTPQQLMREIAFACGASPRGDVRTLFRNLRWHLRGRKVAFILDEAQHLGIPGLETVRELHDQAPHAGLLFLGSHNFDQMLEIRGVQLEQWRSRFHFKRHLPGISDEEAETIVRAELGEKASRKVIAAALEDSRVKSFANPRERYISARSLFNALAEVAS